MADAVALDGTSLQTRTFTVTPPEVKESTTMQIGVSRANPRVPEKWEPAGTVRLVVHPADLLEQIKKQLADAVSEPAVKLVVVGESAHHSRPRCVSSV